jgi:mono/diheme cytochrome c family protein
MTRSFFNIRLQAAVLVVLGSAILAAGEERDPISKRVPFGMRAEVEAMKSPIISTPGNVTKGKAVFEGKGLCFKCHGLEGRGNGRLAEFLAPSPRNFTNPEWQKNRTDGELLWIIKNGSEGTGMVSMAPSEISVEEAWYVVTYIRSLISQ